MEIKLFGAIGCGTCLDLEMAVFNALAELGIDAAVDKIEEANLVKKYGVEGLPAVMINGQLKCIGRVPGKQELLTWIREAQQA
jgi:hypothetical protein